jgi:hypothetical protein
MVMPEWVIESVPRARVSARARPKSDVAGFDVAVDESEAVGVGQGRSHFAG